MDRLLQPNLLRRFTTLSAILMMALTFNASANNIRIHVHDANKETALRGVSVCLGTAGNLSQFGAARTDSRGNVNFSSALPRTPLLLTVSGPQHKGIQRVLPTGLATSNTDLIRTIDLPLGGLGPVCDAPASIIEIKPYKQPAQSRLQIASVNLDQGENTTRSRSVVLSSNIQGEPTHYRISEDPKFAGSDWLEYKKTPLFTLSNGEGQKRVYYQVRKVVEKDTGSIQVTSNVTSDRITLKSR